MIIPESKKKVINKTKNIVSATILVMSVNTDAQTNNHIKDRSVETALNLLDVVQGIRTLTPVYKNQFLVNAQNHIDALLDYLHIGYSVGVLSRMNADILAKELRGLSEMIETLTFPNQGDGMHIEIPNSFFEEEIQSPALAEGLKKSDEKAAHKGHFIKDKILPKIQTPEPLKTTKTHQATRISYVSNIEKRQNRKDLILRFITEQRLQGKNDGVMIKDIVTKIKDISEKTVQRELSALVAKGVLRKIGDKRWSRYVLK
jgi:hypothetical protein